MAATLKVDTAKLRKTHVTGWKPKQCVWIEAATLGALLDELDALRARRVRAAALARAWRDKAQSWRNSHEPDFEHEGEDCEDTCHAESLQVERCAQDLDDALEGP